MGEGHSQEPPSSKNLFAQTHNMNGNISLSYHFGSLAQLTSNNDRHNISSGRLNSLHAFKSLAETRLISDRILDLGT